tara:strand:+ start:171235 stop:171465 length:231 start_codon:yes stop_codon:yes gene_type:complete
MSQTSITLHFIEEEGLHSDNKVIGVQQGTDGEMIAGHSSKLTKTFEFPSKNDGRYERLYGMKYRDVDKVVSGLWGL